MLQINYKDILLRDLATKESVADDTLGSANARELRALISEAEAFPDVQQFLEFRCSDLPVIDPIVIAFGINCHAHFSRVFAGEGEREDGSVDWGKVKTLMLERVLP